MFLLKLPSTIFSFDTISTLKAKNEIFSWAVESVRYHIFLFVGSLPSVGPANISHLMHFNLRFSFSILVGNTLGYFRKIFHIQNLLCGFYLVTPCFGTPAIRENRACFCVIFGSLGSLLVLCVLRLPEDF